MPHDDEDCGLLIRVARRLLELAGRFGMSQCQLWFAAL
jgi:hypothetical protein